jgi:hypothetical protein
LVLFQTTNPAWQGVYTIVQGTGGTPTVLTRGTDWDQASEMNPGDQFSVVEGTLYGASQWMFSQVNAITVGTTALTFNQIAGQGALLKANNLSDLPSAATARTNLGLAIGTNVQAFNAALQSISGLTTIANNMIYTTALNTYAVIAPGNSSVMISSAGGVPSWGTTLPNINLGTPSAIVLTNATGLPVGGLTGLGTGVVTALGQNVTGSGGIVLATSPTITTPVIGAIKGTNGFNVATFADAALTTDYWAITSGISNNAIIQLTSSNANASASILAKGTGGFVLGSYGVGCTNPLVIQAGTFYFALSMAPSANRLLTFPDGNRDLTTVPALTSTANQILLSSSNAQSVWSTATYPATAGTSGNYIKSNGTNFSSEAFTAPTRQQFTSSSGTYTTPAGVLYIKVTCVGGGGGGSGSGTGGGNAGSGGGTTTFGTALLSAGGGASIGSSANGTSPAGGAASGGDVNLAGSYGGVLELGGLLAGSGNTGGGTGAPGYLGMGAGGGGFGGVVGFNGSGFGAGGGGAGGSATLFAGQGGGGGATVLKTITSPSATYPYAVGTGDTGGTAGTSGHAGGNGSAGVVIVEEYYQ